MLAALKLVGWCDVRLEDLPGRTIWLIVCMLTESVFCQAGEMYLNFYFTVLTVKSSTVSEGNRKCFSGLGAQVTCFCLVSSEEYITSSYAVLHSSVSSKHALNSFFHYNYTH
jgi:hypothetical protein